MRGVFRKHAAHIHVESISKVIMYGGSGIGIWTYTKNTLLLRFYKQFVELKGENGPVESSVKLTNLVNEVIEDLKDRASEYTDIEPVIVPGQNVFSMGTWGTFSGGFIGLPAFFEYSTIDEIADKIEVKNKTQGSEAPEIQVESDEVYNLFLLSEEAKKYAIAREVLLINNLQVYVDTMLPFTASCIACAAINFPTVMQGLMAIPTQTRAFFFMSVTLGVVFLWRKAHSLVKRYYEKDAADDISSLGENYLRGALEYNSKEMQRNAYVVEMKGQNERFLNIVRDKLRVFIPRGFSPSQKYQYFKSVLETNTVVSS